MVDFLIKRPIAVIMTLFSIFVLGVVAANLIPVSLMPEVKIPRISVQVSAPDMSSREIEKSIIAPLKNQLIQLNHLTNLHAVCSDGRGSISLEFSHGSDIDYLFIEVNEKIDRTSLPKEIDRPRAVKANVTDIPAFYMNINLRNPTGDKKTDTRRFTELSKFALSVVAKRLEQIPEVAMVDITGQNFSEILIIPDHSKMDALGVTMEMFENIIRNNHVHLGSLNIRDGHYIYTILFSSSLESAEDIGNIYWKIYDKIYQLKELAVIREQPQKQNGLVMSDGVQAVSMAIIKQADARMFDLKERIQEISELFEKDYPDIKFTITRDQTALLDYSISSLIENLLMGILFASIVIFFFMKDFYSPLLISITIPVSLVLSVLLMYTVGISINIISLSGLILAVGMMVDNSIIVIDNITQFRNRERQMERAIARGTHEVITPIASSVLTTCSVFIPLIFLGGISGALFYDQAMAVTIGLVTSFLVSIIIIPVLYSLFYRKKRGETATVRAQESLKYMRIYETGMKWVFRHQFIVILILAGMIVSVFLLFSALKKEKLPVLTEDDLILNINWNRRINLEENNKRSQALIKEMEEWVSHSTAMPGIQKFVLDHTRKNDISECSVYLKARHPDSLNILKRNIRDFLSNHYAEAVYSIENSGNIFDQLFSEKNPPLVARIRSTHGGVIDLPELEAVLQKIRLKHPEIYIEPVPQQEIIQLQTIPEMMTLYGITYNNLFYKLKSLVHENIVLSLSDGEFSLPIVLGEEGKNMQGLLLTESVRNSQDLDISLSYLLKENRNQDLKYIVSGPEGEYYPLNLYVKEKEVTPLMQSITTILKDEPLFEVSYDGSYFDNKNLMKELFRILIVSLLLLYFILGIQFESLIQPIIILLEIVIDLFGSLFLLWIVGASLNMMSMIGIIVMCGIVINDSILKVDTINRIRREGRGLLHAVMLAGSRRLKPIIMTSLTTILAVLPFLFSHNMGADLQYPLSLAIIGGMTVGTIVSIYFIPLVYYWIYKKRA